MVRMLTYYVINTPVTPSWKFYIYIIAYKIPCVNLLSNLNIYIFVISYS